MNSALPAASEVLAKLGGFYIKSGKTAAYLGVTQGVGACQVAAQAVAHEYHLAHP